MMQWYVLQVETGKEATIKDRLEAKDIQTLLPMRTVIERREGKERRREKALLPSYLFICVEYDLEIYHLIKQEPMVLHWLGAPSPVPEDEMEPILELCRYGDTIRPSTGWLDDNGRVQILSGPLKGFEGKIIRYDKRTGRARICLDVLDTPHIVDLTVRTNQDKA